MLHVTTISSRHLGQRKENSFLKSNTHKSIMFHHVSSHRERSFASVFSLLLVCPSLHFLLSTPSPTTLQISQLHYINLPCLNLLPTVVKKPLSLQLLDENLLLQYLFLCRASVDVMVPRARRGGETASMMRMVAPH